MIIGFFGTVGGGKTLSAVEQAYKYYRMGSRVYSNIGLTFPHTLLTRSVLLSYLHERESLQDAVVLIDEIHIWMDSRSSMAKKNRGLSYFILQSRKRSVRLLYTSQHPHQIDKRLRDTTDIFCYCQNLSTKLSVVLPDASDVLILQELVFQWTNRQPVKRLLHGGPVFPLYDTKEVVSLDDE